MRVVFDTNVMVSGMLWKGAKSPLFVLVEKGAIELCTTPGILEEIRRVLRYPKIAKQLRVAGITIEEVMEYLLQYASVFEDSDIVETIPNDPSDTMFLNCAVVSGARWVVSGDKHLLSIRLYRDIHITTPAQFLRRF